MFMRFDTAFNQTRKLKKLEYKSYTKKYTISSSSVVLKSPYATVALTDLFIY